MIKKKIPYSGVVDFAVMALDGPEENRAYVDVF